MTVGAVVEPLVIVSLLAGGTLVNRNKSYASSTSRPFTRYNFDSAPEWETAPVDYDVENRAPVLEDKEEQWTTSLSSSRSSSVSTLVYEVPGTAKSVPRWRQRTLCFFGWTHEITTPNTEVYRDRLLSRLLRRLPFLVEVWYWALIYWVYQLGRAFTAVTLKASTVDTARDHALQVIALEKRLGIFIEGDVQAWFLQFPELMRCINRIYSFIHIPGTIMFLIVLFYITTTRPNRIHDQQHQPDDHEGPKDETDDLSPAQTRRATSFISPRLYEKRRRTMAMCNLLAFVVFTLWPCMPPRLLSDPSYDGADAAEAKAYGFVDTVHGADGDSSVWTTNRFCNQYAAMPSLHFGYSFLIGLTIATVPLRRRRTGGRLLPSWKRVVAVLAGMVYPAVILVAIVSTANHFVLDAVAGAFACLLAWRFNGALLNLLPLEDYFLTVLRIHKP
ncbi:PAP2 superfamily-domain-containing protein [Podospora appendiculata]|uniref:PAP2 superfamily-domain-containing protein n=1 Tax=Podospora appendiculata TaxID=314037 RepID=A0AAE0XIU2_9PEZI|nr:PAP2 superfamily-domain-containing protein [Podospora appendiculata]